MAGKLLYRDAQGRDASVDLAGEMFLGRAAECAVRTDDAMVSRKNCKISQSAGRWVVEDLGSSNGTFVNDVRIQKQGLNHSDVIRCGTLQVRFVETNDTMAKAQTEAPASGYNPAAVPAGGGGGGGGGLDSSKLLREKDAQVQTLESERDRLTARLRDATNEVELMHSKAEADQQELRKLRTEVVQLRDRANDVNRQASYRDDEVQASGRIAEELRRDMSELQEEHEQMKTRYEEVAEECAARGRLLERAQDDTQRFKQTAEELRTKLNELQRVKDEGWKELNSRVGEIDQLREVINEQERILEERRIALASFEQTIKDYRADKDKGQQSVVEMRRERDEIREKSIRLQQQVEVLEDEHRRLARAMTDMESGRGGNTDAGNLATELRDTKVEVRKLETEKQRLTERLERAEEEREKLAHSHANIDVDRADVEQEMRQAQQRLERAEESRARAEMARSKAEDERQAALAARDTALQNAASQRKRAEEIDEELKKIKSGDRSYRPSADADKVRALQKELDRLEDELAAAKSSTKGGDLSRIRKRTEEAYYGINDALSELRTNILLAKDLVDEHGHKVSDAGAVDTLNEAIQVSADRAEDAKGLLRSLLEVIES